MTDDFHPVCFGKKEFHDKKDTCEHCDWNLICGTMLKKYFPLERKEFIRKLLLLGHRGTEPEFIEAVMRQYGGTKNATRLAIRYQRRKLELERRANSNPVVG